MASKLYPPYINGTLPAFWLNYDPSNTVVISASIAIPFSDNPAKTGIISGYSLRLRTASSGSYLFAPIFSGSASVEDNTVTFVLNQSQANKLKEGQYYKAQIAYCGEDETDIGYYSTVGVIKCTSKPTVSISNLALENINFFTNEFIGLYDTSNCKDQSEKVYSYSFKMYDELGNIYYDTGELLHNAAYDTDYGYSLDRLLVNEFVNTDTTFSIQYSVTTLNGLELSTGLYKLTNEGFNPPSRNIKIKPEANLDNGYITIHFEGDLDKERSYYYVLNEDALVNEKDNDGNYLKDRNKTTVYQRVVNGISSNYDPLDFVKNFNVYRYYDNGFDNSYIYVNRNKTLLNDMKTIIIDNKNYYYNDELSYMPSYYYIDYKTENNETIPTKSAEAHTEQWLQKNRKEKFLDENNEPVQGEEILVTPLLYLIATGRELAKSLTYQYIEDNNYYENENNRLQSDNNSYYIIGKEPYEAFYYGAYLLSRASDADNYTTWVNISRFRLEEQAPSSYSIKDFTIEHGRKYMYAVQQYNIWGLYSSRIVSDVFEAGFEDAFLYDGERCLKIRFNPEVSSFKTTVLEQKTDTIGGRFPYITRNGETYYKEFPIGGLIAAEMDDEELFIKRGVVTSHRHSTSAIEAHEPENAIRDYHMFSDENIMLEREFKLAVLDWLNNGQPKLFKSPYEGNYIVRLMNTSLTPVKELGRMLHSFTTTAYEIAEFNYQNLLQFGFLDTSAPTDYVGLWRTYNLADYPAGQDIDITFDVGLMSFSVQDLMPGDIIRVIYGDGDLPEYEDIMIGITGAYMCAGINRPIKGIHIPARPGASGTNGAQQTGVINCYYQGLRITAFDAITGMQLRTIPSYQFIGVDPHLVAMKTINWSEKTNYNTFVRGLSQSEFRNFQGYNIRDYIDYIIEKKDVDITGSDLYFIDERGMKYIASFDPGELTDRINATINLGESDKIKMIKLEQGHFRLRELVPVYAQNTTAPLSMSQTQQDSWVVSVTPFGYPHPIEELTSFEMIDPFCVFEVFQMKDGQWTPAKGRYESPYYDPYYKSWLYDYEPYFQMNYQMKKICLTNDADQEMKPYRRNELTFVTNSETGEQYYMSNNYIVPENRIYDMDIIAEDEETYYYIDKNNQKVYLTKYNYYEDDGKFQLVTLNSIPSPNKIYYIKEYDNNIDLSIVKEKIYKDFEGINSIRIGNGVMAELTFQIKVIDYYTEIADAEVAKAKAEYLEKSQFYKTLMQTYAIIDKAANTSKKYAALAALYERLLQGQTGDLGVMTQEQKDVINTLLNNPADKAELDLQFIYNTLMISEDLGSELTDVLLNHFADNPDLLQQIKNSETVEEAKALLNNLIIYRDNYSNYQVLDLNKEVLQTLTENDWEATLFGEDIPPTFGVDPERITLENINDYNYYKYVVASTGEAISYFIKKEDIDTYYKYNPTTIKSNICFDPVTGKGIDNINKLDGVVIQLLSKADYDDIYNEQLQMYSEEEYQTVKDSDTCLWIQYFNETSLHEETEIENILTGNTTQGASNKLGIIDSEIEQFSATTEDYASKVASVNSQYLEAYNNLKTAIDAYNNRAYYYWGINELYKILEAENPETKALVPLQAYLNNTERSITNRALSIDGGIKQAISMVEEANKVLAQDKQKITLYSTINNDKSNDDSLDQYHEEQIANAKGDIITILFEYYFIGLRILFLLDKYWNDLLPSSILKYIDTYKNIQAEFTEILELCGDLENSIPNSGDKMYRFKEDYEKGFYVYYNELVADARNQVAQLKMQWQDQGALNTETHTQLLLLLDRINFMHYIGNNGVYDGRLQTYPLVLGYPMTVSFTKSNPTTNISYSLAPIMQSNDYDFVDAFKDKVQKIDSTVNLISYAGAKCFIFTDNSTISARLRSQNEADAIYSELLSATYNGNFYSTELTKQGYDEYSNERIQQIYWFDNRTIVVVNDNLKGDSTSSFIYNPLKDYGYTFVFEKISYDRQWNYYTKDESNIYHSIGTITEETFYAESAPEYYIDDGSGKGYIPVHNKVDLETYANELGEVYFYNEGIYTKAETLQENVKYYKQIFIGNKTYFDSLNNTTQQNTILSISSPAVSMLHSIVDRLMTDFAGMTAENMITALKSNSTYLNKLQKQLNILDLPSTFEMSNTNDPLQKAVTDALMAYNNLVIEYQSVLQDSEHYQEKIEEFNSIYYLNTESPYKADNYYSLRLQSLTSDDLKYVYRSESFLIHQFNENIISNIDQEMKNAAEDIISQLSIENGNIYDTVVDSIREIYQLDINLSEVNSYEQIKEIILEKSTSVLTVIAENRDSISFNSSFDTIAMNVNEDREKWKNECSQLKIINDKAIISINGIEDNLIIPVYIIDSKLLQFFTNISELDNTLEDTGVATWYKETLSEEKLEDNQELLQQALELKDLYEKQQQNYQEKYQEYKDAADQSQSIYSSYEGTDELDYYLDDGSNKRTIEEIREEVREAWWAFLNILDEKYTAEKARGMYV